MNEYDQNNISAHTARLHTLKSQLESIKVARTTTKTELDPLESQIVENMARLKIRCVDTSSKGDGPFWVLSKSKTDGSWNRDRYVNFFNLLLETLASGKQMTAAQLADTAVEYIRQYEKRSLVLNKVTHYPRQKNIDDLITWLAGD
jgi:hypothetical protein